MRIINKTDYPTTEVRKYLEIGARGLDVGDIMITVKKSRKWVRGTAWWGYSPRIVIYMPSPDRFPFKGWRRHRSSPLNHDHRDWREALVSIGAHECRHIDLWRNGYFRRKRTTQEVEMNCEAYERYAVDRYREAMSAVAA